MHTMLIHQLFVSPDDAGGTRHFELGKRLVENGHEFSIIAGTTQYYNNGSRRANDVEEFDGVRVFRAYSPSGFHKSYLRRVWCFVAFMWSSLMTGLRIKQVDLVMGTTPPIFQALSGCLIAKLRRLPFLLEVRDLWPEFMIDIGLLKNPLLIWVARRVEHFLYRNATQILVNSPAYRDYLIKKGVPEERIHFVANGVDTSMFAPDASGDAFRSEWKLEDKFVVTYAGAMGIANDLDTMLDAAALLQDDERIQFLMVGDGKERPRLEQRVDDEGLKNVTFTGPIPKSRMSEVLAASDSCVATLKNIPMFATTYPNKVFDYMAAARPIILGIKGVIRDVVEAADAGVPIEPGSGQELAEAVRKLSADLPQSREMGHAGREYVSLHFNRDTQAREFQTLLEGMAPQSRAA